MISVVYFGRNDNHGYNLPKRVTLCLNTTASLLTDPTDEIVFVDYNTPDALPTFPEIIADTLTDAAKARLRILRVRPHHHAAYARLSPMSVVATLALNVGIRRSRPENRWVLMSTTDMLLAPHDDGASLSSICAGLEPGIHQLPRYELPELVWETLDRRDPAAARAAVRQYGRSLHLNEITPTEPPVLYDNPGDFQLVARSDLFEIDGIDERMIIGWNHPDSNIAKRLKLLGRPDRTLASSLAGYHCSHTITLNVTNQARRLENDDTIFVHNVTQPKLPAQRETWGMARQDIEEIRLAEPRARRAIAALEAALAPAQEKPITGGRRHVDFNRAGFPAQHAAPFVANLLAFAPPRAAIGWLGPKGPLHAAIARWLQALGDGQTLVDIADAAALPPDNMPWVIVNLGIDHAGTPTIPEHLHQVPIEQQQPVWDAFASFTALARLERAAATDSGRQYLVLNAIHTTFEPVVTELLGVAMTPHTMRLRAGPVRRAAGPSMFDSLAAITATALQHRHVPAATEVSRALGEALVIASDPAASLVGNAATVALLRSPEFARMVDTDAAILRDAAGRLDGTRRSHGLASRIGLPLAANGGDETPSLSKLAAAEDWEDAGWRRWAELVAPDSYDYFRRDREIWVRAHLLHALDRLGLLDAGKSVAAVVANGEDLSLRLAALRAAAGGSLTMLSADKPGGLDWSSRPIAAPPLREPVQPAAGWTGAPFDGVVVLPGCLPRFRAATRLGELAKLVAPGGHLVAAVEVALDGNASNAWVPLAALRDGSLAGRAGLAAAAPFDERLTALTLDRTQLADDKPQPHLVLDDKSGLITWAAWLGRR